MSKPAHQIVFTGPLFVVGMVRSGTKLLRTLLCGHPRVHIPVLETDFLPLWIARWDRFGNLSERDAFARFFDFNRDLPYFTRARSEGLMLTPETWQAACADFSPAGVFEALVRLDCNVMGMSDIIWGDKTPSYTQHIATLSQHFPTARFVHIIRDVRDYCLSVRQAWNKSMLRAAQRWFDDVSRARRQGAALGDRYVEIRYEDLITSPEHEMARLCQTIGLEMHRGMLQLKKSVEKKGAARSVEIDPHNKGKYTTRMSGRARRRIESVSAPLLRELGYAVDYDGPLRRIGRVHNTFLTLRDTAAIVADSVRSDGLTRTARQTLRVLAMKR